MATTFKITRLEKKLKGGTLSGVIVGVTCLTDSGGSSYIDFVLPKSIFKTQLYQNEIVSLTIQKLKEPITTDLNTKVTTTLYHRLMKYAGITEIINEDPVLFLTVERDITAQL